MKSIRGLYALCDNSQHPHRTHREMAEALLRGGVRVLQLRMKGETDLERVRRTAGALLELKRDFDFTFILNDFIDLAADLPVDGVHIGREDPDIAATRRRVGPEKLLGYSSHSLEEAREAERRGADYVAFGAIFPTTNKGPGHPIQGLKKLQEVVSALKVPVVAIGGIQKDNFAEVVSTGVAAVAMIGALAGAEDMETAARWFVEKQNVIQAQKQNP